MNNNLLCILGATATGKTTLAIKMARLLNGEIISADSRQIYRNMDIGTGKDLEEYQEISHHLIDIHPAGYKYNIFEYQQDFSKAFLDVTKREKTPILCGGSGLYVESVVKNYKLQPVPVNPIFRKNMERKSLAELVSLLKTYKPLHNTTDTSTKKRTIRALEIASYEQENKKEPEQNDILSPLIIGIVYDVKERRKRITERLHQRLEAGMVAEVEHLLDNGVSEEDLLYYGLEYKFITQYLTKQLSYEQMVSQLNTAIHRFAKRQMTWFRRMERNGISIHWLEGNLSLSDKASKVIELWQS